MSYSYKIISFIRRSNSKGYVKVFNKICQPDKTTKKCIPGTELSPFDLSAGYDDDHYGIDITSDNFSAVKNDPSLSLNVKGKGKAGTDGNKIYAYADGEIYYLGEAAGFGTKFLIIKHDATRKTSDGKEVKIFTCYGHLPDNGITKNTDGTERKQGDKVKGGEHIAYEGNEGKSDGFHLHFEMYVLPIDVADKINPGRGTYGQIRKFKGNPAYTPVYWADPLDWLPIFKSAGGKQPDDEYIEAGKWYPL